jgi:glutamine amidotransferase
MSHPKVTVIDFGVGNLLSVKRALEYCGADVEISSDPVRVRSARMLVLAGVGAFTSSMRTLENLGLTDAIRTSTGNGVPLLGICLGMQLLLSESEEFGPTRGLNLIPGRVVAIPCRTIDLQEQKVPHIGWNALVPSSNCDWSDTLLSGIRPGSAVYFVHSFMGSTLCPSHRVADCLYGGHRIAAFFRAENISGCQFHPEKSGEIGLKIIQNFVSG